MEEKQKIQDAIRMQNVLYPGEVQQETEDKERKNVYSEVVQKKMRYIRLLLGRTNFRTLIIPYLGSSDQTLAMRLNDDVLEALSECTVKDIESAIGEVRKFDGEYCHLFLKQDFLICKMRKIRYHEDGSIDTGAIVNIVVDTQDAKPLFFVEDDEAQECEITIVDIKKQLDASETARLREIMSRTNVQSAITSFLSSRKRVAEFRLSSAVMEEASPFSAYHMNSAIDCDECIMRWDDCVMRLIKADARDRGPSYMTLNRPSRITLAIGILLSCFFLLSGIGMVSEAPPDSNTFLYDVFNFLFWGFLVSAITTFICLCFCCCGEVKSGKAIARLPAIDFVGE